MRSGAQALWGRETMAGMADGGLAAYGMPVGGRLVGMPSFGIGASGHGRDYRLGYGLTVAQGGAMHFELVDDSSRLLPAALVALSSNVPVAPVEGGGFSGIDATSAQIVQC